MRLCFRFGDKKICVGAPEVIVPFHFPPPPEPDPRGYTQLLQDASVIASLQAALSHVSDAGVRGALHEGIQKATRALQSRAGEHFTIENEAAHNA